MRALRNIALILALMAATPALAFTPLNDRELDAVRGGYVSANGLTFGFGAQIQTYVNGVLALQSTLTLANGPASDAQTATTGPLGAFVASQGAFIPGDGGSTTILNSFNSGQILNLVVNSASNRTIRQDTQVVLALPAFASTQRGAAFQQLNGGLQAALGFGLTRASAR